MKRSVWINLIGTLCIIFGAFDILGNILNLLMPELSQTMVLGETPAAIPSWHLWLAGIGIAVGLAYLLSGYFFILKTSFALHLIYSSLILSIIYAVFPLFIVAPYNDLIFVLISPFIDLVILLGVIRLSKGYYNPEDSLIMPFGKYELRKHIGKLLTIASIIFTAIPFLIQSLWIYAYNSGTTPAERTGIFNHFLPDAILGNTNYYGLFSCLLAIILSSVGLTALNNYRSKLYLFLLSLSTVLFMLNLFQLM